MNTTETYPAADLSQPISAENADTMAAQQTSLLMARQWVGQKLHILRQPPLKYALISFWALCTLVVVGLSLSSHGVVPGYHHMDKVAHFSAYFSLAILPTFLSNNTKHIILVIGALTLLGIGLEGLQSLLPHRSSSLYDLLANLLGVSFGSAIGLGMRHWTKRMSA